MAQLGSAQREPSMEEILASIRRIIEDGDTSGKSAHVLSPVRPDNDAAPPAAPAESAAADKIKPMSLVEVQAQVALDRTAARAAAERDYREAEAFRDALVAEQPGREQRIVEPVASPQEWRLGVPKPDEEVEDDFEDDRHLEAALSEVFDDISAEQSKSAPIEDAEPAVMPMAEPKQAIVSETTGRQVAAAFEELTEAFAARSKKSIDEMAEDLMRPMLQEWLDNNLPLMVERLVREEIERIARGG